MDALLLPHARPIHLCPSCGAPDDITSLSCFCEPVADADPPCSTCGAAFGEHDAQCAECRRTGRVDCDRYLVDLGLARFLDEELQPLMPLSAPPRREEEPLPTIRYCRDVMGPEISRSLQR